MDSVLAPSLASPASKRFVPSLQVVLNHVRKANYTPAASMPKSLMSLYAKVNSELLRTTNYLVLLTTSLVG